MFQSRRLLKRLRAGDKNALCQVYELYIDDLIRVAASLLYNIQESEDCIHDVFVSFAAGVNQMNINCDIKKYLVSCVANRARDILRRKAKIADCPLDQLNLPSIATDPLNKLISDEESSRVFCSLAHLPFQQREVFVLHVQGGLKFREIAALLDVSVNTVQSRYRYGIQKLQEVFSK